MNRRLKAPVQLVLLLMVNISTRVIVGTHVQQVADEIEKHL